MAGALRRVSQNYNWTIKRAHNDFHDVIHSQPQTASHSHEGIGSVDIPLVSSGWDPNRLRGKVGIDYAELRKHLEHFFFIFFNWATTVLPFVRIGMRFIITNSVRSVIRINRFALATLLFCLMSMWHLWFILVRSAASLALRLLRGIFNFFLSRNAKPGIKDKTGVKSVSWAEVHAEYT